MGLMNAIGLQPRNPVPSVTSQGTQTAIVQLQNAETQTEREPSEPGVSQQPPNETPSPSRAAQAPPETSESGVVQDGVRSEGSTESSGPAAGPAEAAELGSGEDALARIRRLIAEGGMTAVVQREQSTTMASMGGFGNNIIVSHRIHRGSQTGPGASRPQAGPSSPPLLLSQTFPLRPLQAAEPPEQLSPMWGPQVLRGPQSSGLSVAVDMDDVFDAGRAGDDDSLPGPSSSSLLLSSPSSSSSSQSPLSSGRPNSYPGDPYSR